MRVARFDAWLRALITADACPAIRAVRTFAQEGITDPPCGLVLVAANGASLFLHSVATSPDGGEDFAAAERVRCGEPLPPVPAAPLALARGRVRLADVDEWLRSLIVNAASPEICGVSLIADRPGYYHSRGLKLRFFSGATITCMWRFTVPAGGTLPAVPFEISEAL